MRYSGLERGVDEAGASSFSARCISGELCRHSKQTLQQFLNKPEVMEWKTVSGMPQE
jgi:hypothetical protein